MRIERGADGEMKERKQGPWKVMGKKEQNPCLQGQGALHEAWLMSSKPGSLLPRLGPPLASSSSLFPVNPLVSTTAEHVPSSASLIFCRSGPLDMDSPQE